MARKFNRDIMNTAAPRDVAMAAMTAADRMQDFKPEITIMGAAVLFLTLAEALDIPAQEVFTATKNLINGDDGNRVEFAGLEDYVKEEIL
jgi:hypothetical protein